jgi:hypothetical protein
MKKIIFTVFSICIFFSQLIQAQSYNSPESVEFDYANNRYLIANRAASQILARSSNGTLSIFATLTGQPYGIEIVGDTLYCCVGGTIRGVNLNTGIQMFNKNIATGDFLNGITHDPSGNLFITGFTNKMVYRFNTATRQSNVFVNNTTSVPNGIIYDAYDGVNPRLVLAGWGTPATIKSISLADSSISLLVNTPFGNIDGIAKGKNGNFYISSWSPNSSIQKYDSTFASSPTAMVTTGISSPADIFYNKISDTLAVPYGSGTNGSVKFYYFGNITPIQSNIISNQITIYPNPSNGLINIFKEGQTIEKASVNLYELGSGKLVYTEMLNYLGSNISIDFTIASISSGIYLVELIDEKGIISRQKLTIE